MSESKSKVDVYQIVTEKIVEQLEKGLVPWHKSWLGVAGSAINYVTRKPYRGINTVLLPLPGEYLTFKQVKACGGTVKKGEKSSVCVFWSRQEAVKKDEKTGEDKIDVYFILRYYNVFHLSQTEGIKSKIKDSEIPAQTLSPIDYADEVFNAYISRNNPLKLEVRQSDEAYYSPSLDKVVVPELSQYNQVEEFYSTLSHELVHSTGKKGRCDRGLEQGAFFGSEVYSKEELVAEIGAAMTLNRLGIGCKKAFKNSVAYIQSWLKVLKNDKKLIVWASSQAQKAVDFIFGETAESENTESETQE